MNSTETISSTSDKATVRKILARRAAAGNACVNCPTCTRPAADGFNRTDATGRVVAGCIDPCHVPHVSTGSHYGQWLNRAAARAWRRAELG